MLEAIRPQLPKVKRLVVMSGPNGARRPEN